LEDLTAKHISLATTFDSYCQWNSYLHGTHKSASPT